VKKLETTLFMLCLSSLRTYFCQGIVIIHLYVIHRFIDINASWQVAGNETGITAFQMDIKVCKRSNYLSISEHL